MRRLLLLLGAGGALWWLARRRRDREPRAVVGYADGSSVEPAPGSVEHERLIAAARPLVDS
jgi:hypothetical protein